MSGLECLLWYFLALKKQVFLRTIYCPIIFGMPPPYLTRDCQHSSQNLVIYEQNNSQTLPL